MALQNELNIHGLSRQSWEDAVHKALHEATTSIKNIKAVTIRDMETRVSPDEQLEYVVKLQVKLREDAPAD